MKQFCKTVLFTCLFCSSLLMIGQEETYQEFAPIGATWHYTLIESFSAPNKGYIKLQAVGDTIILGQKARIIEYNTVYSDQTIFSDIQTFIYQDGGTIYYFIHGAFYILYDFEAQIGDTWETRIPSAPPYPIYQDTMMTVQVDSVGSMLIEGSAYKTLYTRTYCNGGYCSSEFCNPIVEKIGDLFCYILPLEWAIRDVGVPFGVRCYEDDQLQVQWETPCEIIFTDIPTENRTPTITIFPNPTNHWLNVQLPETLTITKTPLNITIYDVQGVLQWQQQQTLTDNELLPLDISFLTTGIYWVVIEYSKFNYSTKILKI